MYGNCSVLKVMQLSYTEDETDIKHIFIHPIFSTCLSLLALCHRSCLGLKQ